MHRFTPKERMRAASQKGNINTGQREGALAWMKTYLVDVRATRIYQGRGFVGADFSKIHQSCPPTIPQC